MRPVRWIPDDTKFDFMRWRTFTLPLSALAVLASLILPFVIGLNFGIDFRGGMLMEVRSTQGAVDVSGMRNTLNGLNLGEVSLQQFGGADEVLIRVQRQDGSDEAQGAVVEQVKQALGSGMDFRRTEFVGPQVGRELVQDGFLALALAALGILVYVWFRFEWAYGMAAVIALLHDVVATLGFYAVTGMEFNLTSVAALLTVAGYSINDTVVVFDRVRDDLRKYKKKPLIQLLNDACNMMLARTILTSVTVLLALFALVGFGGDVLRGFSAAMIFGVATGVYSSVFVALPLLLYFNVRRTETDEVGGPQPAEQS
jgi:preprotein translocase subunit SecF